MTTKNPFPGMNPFFEQRWRDAHSSLITYLRDALQERLPPDLMIGAEERDRYGRKCRALIRGGVNLVEIDLVRQGAPVFPEAIRKVLHPAGACYGICVFRAARSSEREVFPIRLRDRLPAIRVPLRPTDADVVVDLQPLIDQCHERGRYHLLNYQLDLDPPLPPEEAVWVDQVLRDHDLR